MIRSLGRRSPNSDQGLLLDCSSHQSSRRSPVAPDVRVPADGEPVEWTSRIRADIPGYVEEQIDEATHRMRCTKISLILRALAAYRVRGRPVFFVRQEDLAADRRKSPRYAAAVRPAAAKPSTRTRQIWPGRPGAPATSD